MVAVLGGVSLQHTVRVISTFTKMNLAAAGSEDNFEEMLQMF